MMKIDIFYDPKESGLVLQFEYKGEMIRSRSGKLVDVHSVAELRYEVQQKMEAIDKMKDPQRMANILMELSVFEGKLAMASTKRLAIKYYNETAEKILMNCPG